MKKKSILIVLLIFLTLFTGCGKKDENKIKKNNPDLKKDVVQNIPDVTDEPFTVDTVESYKRNTDTENNIDEIFVKVKGHCDSVECELQYKLIYNYYTEGGWIMDEMQPADKEKWTITPTTGMSSDIHMDFQQSIADYGYGDESYFGYVTTNSRYFDQDSQSETITYGLTTTTPFRDFSAELSCTYRFVSYCEDSHFSWHWERDYDRDNYTVISNDYSKIAGEWQKTNIDPAMKYETGYHVIEQLSSNEFAINACPGANSYNDYVVFQMVGNSPQITGVRNLDKIYSGRVNGATISFNTDGSIDYVGGFGRSGHLVKK